MRKMKENKKWKKIIIKKKQAKPNKDKRRVNTYTHTHKTSHQITREDDEDDRSILAKSLGGSTSSPFTASFPLSLESVAKVNSCGLVGRNRTGREGAGIGGECGCASAWFRSRWSVAKWNSCTLVGLRGCVVVCASLHLFLCILSLKVATVLSSCLSSWVRLSTPCTRLFPLQKIGGSEDARKSIKYEKKWKNE